MLVAVARTSGGDTSILWSCFGKNIPQTMGSLRVSETATSIFRCHACGGAVPELKARAFTSLVGSDCTPASGNVRIGVCQACGLLQKDISPAWSELCAKIYGSYRIYHQGAGQEQKARGTDGGELKPRSELIAEFLCNTRKLPPSRVRTQHTVQHCDAPNPRHPSVAPAPAVHRADPNPKHPNLLGRRPAIVPTPIPPAVLLSLGLSLAEWMRLLA